MTKALIFAAANPLLVLLVLGVTLVFYIVQAVFKSTMEPKKLQPPARPARPPAAQRPQTVPNQAIHSLEDYLKEARRRRAMETGAPALETRPKPQPAPTPTRPETFKPILVPAPVADQRTAKPGQPNIPTAPRPGKKNKPQRPAPSGPAASTPVMNLIRQDPALAAVPKSQANLPEQVPLGPKPAPLAQLIAISLRDPKSLAGALLLREILGPPASARARRTTRVSGLPALNQPKDS